MKFYCESEEMLLDVPQKKLFIKTKNSKTIIGCDNIKLQFDGHKAIHITFLVKNVVIGIIEFYKKAANDRELKYINLDMTSSNLEIVAVYE